MKIFKVFLITVSTLLLLSGCSEKCPEPPEPIIKTQWKTKTEYVEIPCKVPKLDCDFTGENFEPTKKLLECVTLQKRALERCSGKLTKKEK